MKIFKTISFSIGSFQEAVNLFVTSGSVVKLKFVPGAYQKIIHQREIMQEVRFR